MAFRKVAVIGTGAIGGYYGARLARAGCEVHFLARSDFAVLKERGFTIETPLESWTVPKPIVHQHSAAIGTCDLVLVALKATGNGVLNQLLEPLVGSETVVMTLENGLGCDELIAQQFGAERVIGGLCFICVYRTSPGRIVCLHPGSISMAEYVGATSERLLALSQLFQAAGVKSQTADDLVALRWRKLVWNVPFNGLAIAAGGLATDAILSSPLLEAEVRALMLEVIEGAAVFGVKISADFAEQQIASTRGMGNYQPSSLVDFKAGREVEVEAIWGEPLRRAESRGGQLPRIKFLYTLLKQLTPAARDA